MQNKETPFQRLLKVEKMKMKKATFEKDWSMSSETQCNKNKQKEYQLLQIREIISKPKYFYLSNGTHLIGNQGHGTVLLGKPILQGNYWLTLRVVSLCYDKGYPSAMRVGCCPYDFSLNLPLGCNGSIGYKSIDGAIVTKNKVFTRYEKYQKDDIIGIGLKIAPPHKYSSPFKVNLDSKMQIYKNGMKLGQYTPLYQTFYSFALSLFNFAQVQILAQTKQGYVNWSESTRQKIIYKSLQRSKIFK